LEGKSKITPALCLKETISLRHSMTQVIIIPAIQYAIIVPAPPQSVIITPVLTKSPMPMVPETAIPKNWVSQLFSDSRCSMTSDCLGSARSAEYGKGCIVRNKYSMRHKTLISYDLIPTDSNTRKCLLKTKQVCSDLVGYAFRQQSTKSQQPLMLSTDL